MARLEDWNKYMNLLHELALVEDDLREAAAEANVWESGLAQRILFERFDRE